MLQPYRALDFTDDRGYLCGKILADLGADVIKVENPRGDPGRRIGPFYKGIPDPEKSLYWFAFNSNKRGITLNIDTADGREIFRRLAKDADFVIESFPPGYMEELGLGYSELSQINPGIIMTSISPFGQDGPYRDYAASDIVIQALSGLLYASGDQDRAPVRISFPQSALFAGAEAAVGTLVALNYRHKTREGQHVEVSMHTAVFPAMFDVILWWGANKIVRMRQGSARVRPDTGIVSQQSWPCKDGYVNFYFFGGAWSARANKALVDWMDGEGYATDYLKQINWEELDWSALTEEEVNQLEEPTGRFFKANTRKKLFEGAIERDILLYPVNTIKDVREDKQLRYRQYWAEVEHDELGTKIMYPSAWLEATEAEVGTRKRAPRIGEHNWEIYGKGLGFTPEELFALKGCGVI